MPLPRINKRAAALLLASGACALAAGVSVLPARWLLALQPEQSLVALADASGTPASADDAGLRDYLEAHRQMAGPSAVRQVSFDVGAGR
ncbi:hypothetical protein G6F68_017898 [Rhizopus microsporus]|nr:hypothetical protein G6F68_017898 [Rhizopus microsporus]